MDDVYSGADDAFEILGIAGTDYVGAGPLAAAAAMQQKLPASIAANPRLMQAAAAALPLARQVDKSRRLRQQALAGMVPQICLPCNSSSAVTANSVTNGTLAPEASVPMRLTEFNVAKAVADYFLINSIRVARLDLLGGSGGVPASVFSPDSRHPPLENPILPAGSPVNVQVENIDAADHFFYSTFFGIDLTPAHARIV